MSETGFINLELECPHCKHKFAYEFQFLIKKSDDVILDRILSNKCPNCGNASIMDMAFFYYDNSDANILYLVFPSEQINYFERIKKSADSMLSKYFEEISFSQQRIIRNAKRKFIEYTMFLSLLQGKGQDHLFMRNIRFTPTPSITFDDRFLLKGPLESLDLDKNDIAFDDKGISKIQKNIIFDTVQKLDELIPINLKTLQAESKPSVTCGFLEIAMVVGSATVIPILVNVLSDIITDYRHKKEDEAKEKLTGKDSLSVIIKEDGSQRVLYFEGSADSVAKALKECGQSSLPSLSIKNCHTATAVNNMIMDLTLPVTHTQILFESGAQRYQKLFDNKSAIEFESTSSDEVMISYKATCLMRKGKYEEAYWFMQPYVNRAQSIEFYYNFALCLKHLDADNEQLLSIYEHVIRLYLSRADLKDLEKMAGSISQSDINKINEKFADLGIIKRQRDEDGDVLFPEMSDKEIENTKVVNALIWDQIHKDQNQDISKLEKEAQINKATILLNERMKEITNMLKLFQKKVDLTLEDETTIDMLKKDRSFLELLLKHPEIMIDMLSNDGNRE